MPNWRRKSQKVENNPNLTGLKAAMRMKGGVRYDPQVQRFFAIVHMWDNAEMRGTPDEWRSSESFVTEEAALAHYKRFIQPSLLEMMREFQHQAPGNRTIYRRLE